MIPSADHETGIRWLARAIAGTFAAGLLALFVQGADRPADPYLKPASVSGGPAAASPSTSAP